MKHYLDLVPLIRRVRRRQERMAVISIVLAVFLVTAIFGMADMFIRSQILQSQIENGTFHIAVRDITDQEAEWISGRPDIESAARYGVLNFRGDQGYTFSGKNAIIVGCDETWMTELQTDAVLAGRFPKNDEEVIVTWNTGAVFGLEIGDRISIEGPDGREFPYRISGFFKDAAKTMEEDSCGFAVTTEAYREIFSPGEADSLADYNSMLYLKFSDTRRIQNSILKLKRDCGLSDSQVSENTKLIGLLGQSGSSFMGQVYLSALIFSGLVLTAGVLMIAGSLNRSVAQRAEFFGLLRCIGATPKQVMRIVYREAAGWCRSAIPAGVLMGSGTVWILCWILRALSPEYFAAMPGFGISIPSIAAGSAAGGLTVFLAARQPAKKAAKVSPLAAVTGAAYRVRPVRDGGCARLLPVDIALGIHHAWALRKNFVLMTASFALSIILFLSFSAAVDFIQHTMTPLRPWTSDLSVISPHNSRLISPETAADIREHPAVSSVYGRKFAYHMQAIADGKAGTMDLVSYDETQFEWAEDYLLEGSLDRVQKEKGTGLAVYEPGQKVSVGERVAIVQGNERTEITVAGILSDCPFQSTEGSRIMICSEETFEEIAGSSGYTIVDIKLKRGAGEQDVREIRQMIPGTWTFSDKRMGNESIEGLYYCIYLFLYGFFALTALITVCSMVNSVGLSAAAGMRQYGIYRAVGMSCRQIARMVIAEAAAYTVAGVSAGTVSGLLFHRLLFQLLISNHWGDAWAVPWIHLGIIVCVMLMALIAAVYGPVKRIKQMSIPEMIRI